MQVGGDTGVLRIEKDLDVLKKYITLKEILKMDFEAKVKITIIASVAVLLAMIITAAAICLPKSDKNIYGNYKHVCTSSCYHVR